MADIDLDQLADAYRLRPMSDAARLRAMASAEGCRGWLLDIGGGRGHHAAVWSADGRTAIVVDPSPGMAARARLRAGLYVVRAHSQSLPFRDRTAGLCYFHLSIHYGDWERSVGEALRVTRSGGRIEIFTMGRDAIERSSLARWFPRVAEIDTERFPDPDEVAERCASGGGSVAVSHETESIERSSGAWVDAVEGRFVSTLQLLDEQEIADGVSRFAAEYPDRDTPYRYELMLTRISTVV